MTEPLLAGRAGDDLRRLRQHANRGGPFASGGRR